MRIKNSGNLAIKGYAVTYGQENNGFLNCFCAFLIAISPLLQQYKGLIENAGFTVLFIALPIMLIELFRKKFHVWIKRSIFPLLVFELYTGIIHMNTVYRLFYSMFIIMLFVCICSKCFNVQFLYRCAVIICLCATVLVIIQYISYYIFHYRLDLCPLDLLINQNSIWHRNAVAKDRMYRPSAFFLEPSHMFLYSFPILCILLFSPDQDPKSIRNAVFITIGMLLSTSGFSIFSSVGLWFIYLIFYKDRKEKGGRKKRRITIRTLLIIIFLLCVILIAYFSIPVFQNSIKRVFYETEGSTAIDGRVRLARDYTSTITGRAVWFGTGGVNAETLDFNLSGFYATYIKYGLIGLIFSYAFYIQGLFRLKDAYFWMSFLIIVVSFFSAHTHGTFYMMYFVALLMNGYNKERKEILSLKSKGGVE